MADPGYKVAKNVPGSYYVDDNCIDCDLCRSTAPILFDRDKEAYASYVARQPVTPQDLERCEKALAECPVEAIGNDGLKV